MRKEHIHGKMNIEPQSRLFAMVMKGGAWCTIILLLAIGYMTCTLSLGMPWLVTLFICAIAGILIGLGLGFGTPWVATIVGLSILAVIIQIIIGLFSLFL